METTTPTPTKPKPTYSCRCGLTTHGRAQSSDDKCSRCYTFSLDHKFVGGPYRCDTCNTRLESHP